MSLHPDSVMIFAAGLGTRMGALTRDRPKAMIEVAGRPLIDHALAVTAPAALRRRVVNLHYRPEALRTHLAGRDVILSDETDLLRETGGGLRHALPLLGLDAVPGPVFTLNSDAVWRGSDPFAALAAAWDPARMEALLLLVPRARAVGYQGSGDFARDAAGRLSRGGDTVYTGLQIIRTDRLAAIPDEVFSLNRLWHGMEAAGGLYGLVHDGAWCDVGRPDCIPLAEDMLRHNVR